MRTDLEVADVFRDGAARFEGRYGYLVSREQRQVCRAVLRCRTAALGGHAQRCNDCGHERVQYNSCRNRHCPKCQAKARSAWLAARESELLPIPYFHLVFTLPHQLGPLGLQNKRIVYGLLFRAAADTLRELGADPKHLGAKVGCLMVLHTWGQNLMHHPHVHCVVPGGGISLDGRDWIACKRSKKAPKDFFIHVKVLSAVFRGKFIAMLKQAYASDQLNFPGQLESLRNEQAFESLLTLAVKRPWIVYAKRPFASDSCVLKYLARYTHRVAISNRRLLDLADGQVRFQYKDYAAGQQTKVMSLATEEFMRRFLMHTLPTGFVRIRYYGFLANRYRQDNLQLCRQLLGVSNSYGEQGDTNDTKSPDELAPEIIMERCPVCERGTLLTTHIIDPTHRLYPRRPHFRGRRCHIPVQLDSS